MINSFDERGTILYTGQEIITIKGERQYIYRYIIAGLSFVVGENIIDISSMFNKGYNYVFHIYGSVILNNGYFEIIPESCCDSISLFGISIRDINPTNKTLNVLFGSGYVGQSTPKTGCGNIVIEFVSSTKPN